jgi:hypothetical protein
VANSHPNTARGWVRYAEGVSHSTDQKMWTALPMTLQAKTSASGFTPGTLFYFRVQALTRAGEQAFTQIVSLMVT